DLHGDSPMKNEIRPTSATLEIGLAARCHDGHGHGTCGCFIIPKHVLERFAKDKKLSAEQRKSFADATELEEAWRQARVAKTNIARLALSVLPMGMTAAVAASPPAVTVFDCQHGSTLPGSPVANPTSSTDATAKRAAVETTAVADFYRSVFGRNSLDNAG